MHNIARSGGLFLVSALLAFCVAVPRTASSQTRSTAGDACPFSYDENDGYYDYACPLVTDSATYTASALSGAWFDFACVSSSQTVVLILNKLSWTGNLEFDYGWKSCTGASHESQWLSASNVLYNADQWDHLWVNLTNGGQPQGSSEFFGVTACFSGGANDCL